ncbi:MAG: dihydrodipicolinate synthase family protein [candidate division KSB1 bacterium]|nr:dihydrodipicolinate synthase family protein [candidate division KSB1 bacterium]MDZ7301213.1 dihydrodipicolinate synthase family protein [candidate division KSB1 bacterium]MDZ7310563.1 dihydrodipicolinate synthase family protein [candidate division KSB1 bacterium]
MLTGVYSVLPTPFTPAGEIDAASLRRVIDLYLRAGVDGLTAAGVTSEIARLSDNERWFMLETVMAHVNHRVPVVIGTTTEGLHTCIELSKKAKALGAAAVMISPPRLPKLNSEVIVKHFRTVAEAIDIPIIVQDYPPISGFTMEAALLARIVREVPSARTIKLEDAPTPYKTARVLEQADGLEIGIFGGLGGTYLLEELMAGATGAMTGFAIPEILVNVVRLFHAGEHEKAAEVFYRNVALMRFEFQEGIGMAIRKEILRRRGALAHAGIRPPGTPLEASTQKALDSLLNWFLQQNKDIDWTLEQLEKS